MTAPPTKLYWAYGSNMSKRQMARRCPAAVPLEALAVQNLILRFRGVADVAYRRNAVCEGALWAITRQCERALDAYEGVGDGTYPGLYRKCYFDYVDPDTGTTHKVLYYKMNRHGIMPPSEGYLNGIVEGYGDFGVDTARLERAVEHSWTRKDMNEFMKRRWHNAGKPKMARTVRIDQADSGPPVEEEPLPDVMLRQHPDNSNHCLACPLSERAVDYFARNIKAEKREQEWHFKYASTVVSGLLMKKGMTVAFLEQLK